ncbi:MAG: amino acid decarboxylase [Chloroflexi bacterium]|nr:amino acid decarboxylase [Chloroflexota bacterium]
MDPEAFRAYGKQVIDWIADYLSQPDKYPVLSRAKPGEVKAQLPAAPPAAPEAMGAILADFDRIIMPGITHWNHPGFFAYFAISGSMPGILAETLIAALNVNAMLWRTSPSATELEEVVLDWLRQMVGLPDAFEGVIADTASMAAVLAIAAAREALGLGIREQGMAGRPEVPRLRMYCSEQAHSSIEKAAILVGLGQAGVRKIPVDAEFRMRPEALAEAIQADRREGWLPFCVAATVGTTSTTSIDPVPAIAEICEREKLWLHVDGAYGGSAAIVPELRHVLAGCDRADSIVINPHKWLFTPIDFSAFYIRRPDVLKQAFSLIPEYLRTAEGDAGTVKNYMEYGVQLGRRFRARKFWMIVRTFGAEGMAARIREHVRLAGEFAGWVDASPDFERLAPTPLSTVCFRARPAQSAGADLDRLNESLMEAVNATGKVFLSHTKLNGVYTLRLAIGNIRTAEAHVAEAWGLLQENLERLTRYN